MIFSSTFEEHMERLEAVFSRLHTHNLKLKASKCQFLKSSITYLGHVVSEDGIHTDPEKTEAVRTWPVPKSVKDVRSYIGFTGYYRRFIQDYARIARPLNDLLVGHCTNKTAKKGKTKKVPFIWTDSQQNAFETLKEKLISATILAYADYSLPFRLHTDASNVGLGAVISATRWCGSSGHICKQKPQVIREELSGPQTGVLGIEMGHHRKVSLLSVWCQIQCGHG